MIVCGAATLRHLGGANVVAATGAAQHLLSYFREDFLTSFSSAHACRCVCFALMRGCALGCNQTACHADASSLANWQRALFVASVLASDTLVETLSHRGFAVQRLDCYTTMPVTA